MDNEGGWPRERERGIESVCVSVRDRQTDRQWERVCVSVRESPDFIRDEGIALWSVTSWHHIPHLTPHSPLLSEAFATRCWIDASDAYRSSHSMRMSWKQPPTVVDSPHLVRRFTSHENTKRSQKVVIIWADSSLGCVIIKKSATIIVTRIVITWLVSRQCQRRA